MYSRLSDEEKYTTNMKFAKVVLFEDLTISNADESLYDFIGKNFYQSFNQMLHPDYAEEFLEVCNMLIPGEEYRIVTLLADKDSNYHPISVHIRLMDTLADEKRAYIMDVYGIDRIESSFLDSQQKLDKYRTFMGMSGLVFMEYWPITGRIVFYNYVVQKAYILYESNIENWYQAAVQYAQDRGSNIAEIRQLYENLKNCKEQFEAVIRSGFLNSNHAQEKLEFNCRFICRHNMEIVEATVDRKDILDDDIPYYLTPAGKDPATGLLNKRAIIEYTNDCLADGGNKKFYMILMDIDDFKIINDKHGHLMGDKAIMLMADTMLETLDGRGIAGRFGGDEFFILTEEISDETQLRLLLRSLVSKLKLSQHQKLGIHFTLSMGISQYPEAGSDFNSLFALADKAVYIAKDKGKNRYIIYRPELHGSINIIGSHDDVGLAERQTSAIRTGIKTLLREGMEGLKPVLENICTAFTLNGVIINHGHKLAETIAVGNCDERLHDISYFWSSGYNSLYSDNILTLNNEINVERVDKQVHEQLHSVNLKALIQIALPSREEPECVISFCVLDGIHKWSNLEVSYLDLLGNTIYSVLKTGK